MRSAPGSKSSLDNDGAWGVDTGDVDGSFELDDLTVAICLTALSAPVGTPLHLADFTADEFGNVLASGSIGIANVGAWVGPRLQIRDDSAGATCTGTLRQESGVSIYIGVDPAEAPEEPEVEAPEIENE